MNFEKAFESSQKSVDEYWAESASKQKNLSLRKDSMQSFLDMGLPDRKVEDWKYTKAESFLFDGVESVSFSESEKKSVSIESDFEYQIIFVDGIYRSDLSSLPSGLQVSSLREKSDAFSYQSEVFYREMKIDSFFHLSNACFVDGVLIETSRSQKVDKTVEIVHFCSKNKMTSPRILIKSAALSELSIVERFVSLEDESHFSNSITEIFAESGAQVNYCQLQEQNLEGRHIGHVNLVQNASSVCNILTLALGGKITRFNVNSRLLGEGASSGIHSLYLTHSKQAVDHCTLIDHAVPHCESEQVAKGILTGASRAVFNGVICVREKAQKSNSAQINRNIILDDKSEVDTRPQLQIDADDVKAAHGATVGQLEKDEVFYLQSRGIGKEEAIKMLALGFADEVLFKWRDIESRKFLQEKTREIFSSFMEKEIH